MKLVSYASPRGARAGVITDDGIVDVWDAIGGETATDHSGRLHAAPGGMRAALETVTTERIASAVEGRAPATALAATTLLPPVTDPQKIICIGLNYRAHAEE